MDRGVGDEAREVDGLIAQRLGQIKGERLFAWLQLAVVAPEAQRELRSGGDLQPAVGEEVGQSGDGEGAAVVEVLQPGGRDNQVVVDVQGGGEEAVVAAAQDRGEGIGAGAEKWAEHLMTQERCRSCWMAASTVLSRSRRSPKREREIRAETLGEGQRASSDAVEVVQTGFDEAARLLGVDQRMAKQNDSHAGGDGLGGRPGRVAL